MKTTNMIRRCFFVTRAQAARLTKEASALGISTAELLRKILSARYDGAAR